ncbi:hypothetical protein QEN19_002631 [Hanseniaspora menglaensis]
MESRVSQRVYVKPNIDNVLPYQQFLKSTTSFPSHTLPILYAGGRNLTLQIKDNGCITEQELYNHIDAETIGDVNLNVEKTSFEGTGVDCDIFVLDLGVIIWFNDFGYGINLGSRNIFYHGIIEVIYAGSSNQGYSMCVVLDKKLDTELLNLLLGNCQQFQLQFDWSTANRNCDFDENLYLNFTFVPTIGEFDRHYNTIPESLFFYEWFGINRGEKLISNVFNAVEGCLEEIENSAEYTNSSVSRQSSFSTIDFNEDIPQQEVLESLNQGLADDL